MATPFVMQHAGKISEYLAANKRETPKMPLCEPREDGPSFAQHQAQPHKWQEDPVVSAILSPVTVRAAFAHAIRVAIAGNVGQLMIFVAESLASARRETAKLAPEH